MYRPAGTKVEFKLWLAYFIASLLTAFSPGQAVMLAVSTTLQHGGKRAMLGSFGNAAGILVVAGLALSGVAAVVHAFPAALDVMRATGGLYLVYLGVRQWRTPAAALPDTTDTALFTQGMLVALTNPKGVLFFAALFPRFVRTEQSLCEQFLILTGTFIACAIMAHATFVLIAHHARGWLAESRRLAAMRKVSSLAFVLLGLAMLCA